MEGSNLVVCTSHDQKIIAINRGANELPRSGELLLAASEHPPSAEAGLHLASVPIRIKVSASREGWIEWTLRHRRFKRGVFGEIVAPCRACRIATICDGHSAYLHRVGGDPIPRVAVRSTLMRDSKWAQGRGGSSSARMQATRCPAPPPGAASSGGRVRAQASIACAQRLRKRQPEGVSP